MANALPVGVNWGSAAARNSKNVTGGMFKKRNVLQVNGYRQQKYS
jgi:hypothetical protein